MRGTERCKFGRQRSLRVESSHGGRGPRGLEEGVDVLLCTVRVSPNPSPSPSPNPSPGPSPSPSPSPNPNQAEKANVVVNRLIEEGRVNELGLVVLDEVPRAGWWGRTTDGIGLWFDGLFGGD